MNTIGFITQPKKQEITQDYPIAPLTFTHCAIIGQTGCGKTSSAILPNMEDRIKKGHGILAYDFKGNLHTKIKAIAKRHKRLEDVIELGLPWSPSFNLIEKLSLTELENMLRQAMGMKPEDTYWIENALKITLPLINLYRSIQEFNNYISSKGYAFFNLSCSKEPSLLSLSQLYTSIYDLKNRYTNLQSCQKKASYHIKDIYIASPNKPDKMLIHYGNNLFRAFEEAIEAVRVYKDLDEEKNNMYNTILLTLKTGLNRIGMKKHIHTPGVDINNLLNQGKIVIIRTADIADVALGFLSYSIFNGFKSRFSDHTKQPISVFIDEAQRVLNDSFDLPIDILREAQVEVFLAYQTPSLLIDKIGIEKYESIQTNLATKFLYKGLESPKDTTDLEPFQYYSNLDNYTSLYQTSYYPLTYEEEFEAELEYQKSIGLFERYDISLHTQEEFIIHYDPLEYEKNALLIKFKNKNTHLCKFFDNQNYELERQKFLDSIGIKSEEPEEEFLEELDHLLESI